MATFNYQDNHDLTALKNWYVKTTAEYRQKDIDYSVTLLYDKPMLFHTTKYNRDDITTNIMTVKSLFFYGERDYCNCMTDEKEKAVNAYYVPQGRRTSGFDLPMYSWDDKGDKLIFPLRLVTISEQTKSDYAKQWQSIANSMKRHGINPTVAQAIEDHLQGKTEHIEGFQNWWKRTDRPRIASFKEVVQDRSIQDLIALATDSQYTKGVKVYHKRNYGIRRDKSITLEVRPNEIYYMSASEYAGTGNGDYYCMFSPTQAFFAERD